MSVPRSEPDHQVLDQRDDDRLGPLWQIDGTVEGFTIGLDTAGFGRTLPVLVEYLSEELHRAGWTTVCSWSRQGDGPAQSFIRVTNSRDSLLAPAC